jgi:predicted 3-demethylubiquinone-9 3-methyltransferase (glyoxalase superfamily)
MRTFYQAVMIEGAGMPTVRTITPCLWFDGQAEEAAIFYELDGQPFTALNGGPLFRFSEAVSFQVSCDSQADIDYYWDKLGEGGDEAARQCGWLKDRFGVSWQVVPRCMGDWMTSTVPGASERVMGALLTMKKLDLAVLARAAAP